MSVQTISLVPIERKMREMRREESCCPELWVTLDQVKDPEIPALSIWDMGILQDVTISDSGVVVTITPTYSGCPAMDVIKEDIEIAVHQAGYKDVEVLSQLTPAWTTDWMSSEAQERLRNFGIAAPDDMPRDRSGGCRIHEMQSLEHLQVKCPQCDSMNTRMISEFGSTACKALMQCNDCNEPFDYFKKI